MNENIAIIILSNKPTRVIKNLKINKTYENERKNNYDIVIVLNNNLYV